MRSKLVLAVALALVVPAVARAQELKYEKYKLENGLTVILHEDHSLPVASVNIWYRVGSKDEPVRRSGFAHLFEHLMFMGTKRVPGNDFDRLMEAGGGSNNATTSSDRTNYFSSGPAKLLPTLLWLDADRLEDLGHQMDQKKLDRQRDVVRNERRQTDENRPYGKADLLVEELLYPAGHPYHIPVIGTHEDLEAAQVQDVKDFFANYYVPNNASLVVAGDFDSKKVKELVQKLFGTIARGGEPEHRTGPTPKLEKVVRMSVLDKVQFPRLTFGYNSPAIFAAGDAELDLAANALTAGNTSRLYKRLVYDEKLATSVTAYQSSAQLASLFRIDVLVQPTADLDKVEKIVDEEVARFLAEGPTEAELARAKASFELSRVAGLEGIEAKADKLNEYEYYFGEPNSIARDLERYRKATREGVRDVARKVLTKDARLLLRVLPDESATGPTPRDERPQDGAVTSWKPPVPESFALSNGIKVQLWRRDELPLVSLKVILPGVIDPPGKRAGLAPLTAELMKQGAGDLDALQLADALSAIGAELDTQAGHEHVGASLTVLQRNFPRALELLGDVLRRPRLEAKEFDRVKELHLAKLAEEDDEPSTVAARVGAKLLYGEGAYASPVNGSPDVVGAFTLEDAKRAHAACFRPERATVLVAGAVSAADLKALLEKALGDWKAAAAAVAVEAAVTFPAHEGLRVAIVDRPEAVQTVLRFTAPGVRLADERRVTLRALNTILGGSFTSRLNANLREAHGYTYGAGSRFVQQRATGSFTASSSVRADVTGLALKEFLAELTRIRTGDVSDEEVVKARETLRTDAVQSFSTLRGILGAADDLVVSGLELSTLASDVLALDKVTAAEINKLAKEAVAMEKGVLVLVGDRATILEQIKDLGLPEPVTVDARGKVVTGK